MPRYESAVLNGTVVIPHVGPVRRDIGIRDGAERDGIGARVKDEFLAPRDQERLLPLACLYLRLVLL